jgi:hypothetical protein
MARPLLRTEALVFGFALVACGVVGLLANAGRVEALGVLRTWWPLALVFWGALELYNTYSARRS